MKLILILTTIHILSLSSANAQPKYYSKNGYKCFCGYSEVYQENIEQCVKIRNELEITPITEISCSSCAMNRGLDPLELCSGKKKSSINTTGGDIKQELPFIDQELDRFNTSKNPDPNSSVNELIQIRDFFTIKGGGLFVRFSSSNESHLIVSELYNEGEVYSPNYSNLDCGELTKIDTSIKKAQSFRCTGTSNQGWIEVSVNKGNKLSSIELSLLLGPNVGVRGQWLAEKDFCEQSPEASSSNRCLFDTTNMPPSDHLYNALMRNSYQNVVNAVERGAIKMWDYKMPIMNICAMACQDERIVAYLSQQPGINFNETEDSTNAFGAAIYFDNLRKKPSNPNFDPNIMTKAILKYAPNGLNLKTSSYSGLDPIQQVMSGIEGSRGELDLEVYRLLAERPEFNAGDEYPKSFFSPTPAYFMIHRSNIITFLDIFYAHKEFQWLDSSQRPIGTFAGKYGEFKVNLLTWLNYPEDLESINHTEYLIQKFSPPDIILLESLKKINQISRDCKKSKWSQFGDREEKSCTKKVKSELEKSIKLIKSELDRRGISH